MEERFTQEQTNTLISALRTGTGLPKDDRSAFAHNVRALLKLSDGFIETCDFLADKCVRKMQQYDASFSDEWKSGVSEELQWWWTWTLHLRRNGNLENWANFKNAPFPFERFVAQLDPKATINVLNIGCGPRNTMGKVSAHPNLRITPMDPLAEAYNAVMSVLDAPGTGDIVFGAVEILDQLDLPKYTFISAANCLDHAFNVPKGMIQMASLLDEKGAISLLHWENEAEAQKYLGFHQWNIEIKDNRIHIWNKTSSELFDHEAHGLTLEHSLKTAQKGTGVSHPQISIILKKNLH